MNQFSYIVIGSSIGVGCTIFFIVKGIINRTKGLSEVVQMRTKKIAPIGQNIISVPVKSEEQKAFPQVSDGIVGINALGIEDLERLLEEKRRLKTINNRKLQLVAMTKEQLIECILQLEK